MQMQRLQEWVDFADRRLSTISDRPRILVTAGPLDPPGTDKLIQESKTLEYCHDTVVRLDDHLSMLSLSTIPWEMGKLLPAPPLALYESGDAYRAAVTELSKSVLDVSRSIFHLHAPPYGTPLDQCVRRNEEGLPVQGGLGLEYMHVGSRDVTEVLRELRPAVSLHGHVDDPTFSYDHIGPTFALNPGSEALAGSVRGVWLAFQDGVLTREWGITQERQVRDTFDLVMTQGQKIVRVGFLKTAVEVSEAIVETSNKIRDHRGQRK
jgi:Icc-related predicted phosphoesterase